MLTLAYPAKVTRDEDDRFVVRFRDLPGAVTDGANFAEAMDEAEDLLLSHCIITMQRKEDLPEPGTPKRDEVLVRENQVTFHRTHTDWWTEPTLACGCALPAGLDLRLRAGSRATDQRDRGRGNARASRRWERAGNEQGRPHSTA